MLCAFITYVLFSNNRELSQSVSIAFSPVVLPANEKAKNMCPKSTIVMSTKHKTY